MAGVSSLIECHECGQLHQVRPLPHGAAAKCTRCGTVLYKERRNSLDRTLMLSLAALICFVLANVYPFMTFKMEGREQLSTLFTGVRELFEADLWLLAVVVFFASILLPLVKLLSMLAVLLPLKLGRQPRYRPRVFRLVEILQPWAMMEVYLLGVFVAYVKLTDLATIARISGAAMRNNPDASPRTMASTRVLPSGRGSTDRVTSIGIEPPVVLILILEPGSNSTTSNDDVIVLPRNEASWS